MVNDEAILFVSTEIYAAMQRACAERGMTPSHAACALLVTLGRLYAMEGYREFDVNRAWTSVCELREVFESGFEAQEGVNHSKGIKRISQKEYKPS